VKQAVADLNFKTRQATLDVSEVAAEVKKKGYVTVEDYRLLTGACYEGCKQFLEEKGITKEEMSIDEALALTEGAYQGDVFRKLMEN